MKKKIRLVTLSEYAVSRGVTRQSIEGLIRVGTISAAAVVERPGKRPGTKTRMIRPEIADQDRELLGNPGARPIQSLNAKATAVHPAEPEEDDWLGTAMAGEPVPALGPNSEDVPLTEVDNKLERHRDARISTEELKARKLELEIRAREGKMLDAEKVQARIAQLVGEVKDAILNVPSRIAPLLVGISSPVEMENKLRAELNTVLGGLSRVEGIGK